MHEPRCQRQRSPARRAVLVRPPSAAGSRSLTLLLPLASRGSPRTTHKKVLRNSCKRCSACVSGKQCRCTARRSADRPSSQTDERHRRPPPEAANRSAGALSARTRRRRIVQSSQKAALQQFRSTAVSTAKTCCRALYSAHSLSRACCRALQLYSALQRSTFYSSTASTLYSALQSPSATIPTKSPCHREAGPRVPNLHRVRAGRPFIR